MAGKMAKRNYRVKRRKQRKFIKAKYLMGRALQSRGLTGLPDNMYVKLKLAHPFKINYTALAPGYVVIRGNDIFDPDNLATSYPQPYLSDQLGSLYQKFVVHASKIKLRASTDNSADAKILLRPSMSASAITDYSLSVERPECKNCFFTSQRTCVLQHYQTTKQALGTANVNDDLLYGTCGASGPTAAPSTKWFWAIAADSVVGGLAGTVTCQAEITYYVKFFRRALQTSS